ncbi:MAG: class I SAM-dependent methyltransferase [Bacteroidetes bacterium]|nr:class I SAM-dependent methyltransferase [Bacteroidota bacterium]
MKDFWNKRFSEKEYVYGTNVNTFLAQQLQGLTSSSILFPCEGEGRNAIFAAQKGWQVHAFDQSEKGKEKALGLADIKSVAIDYVIGDALTVDYPNESFDVIALIYAHFPDNIRKEIHHKICDWLKPNGTLIVEAFNPRQLANTSGGPKDTSMLYTKEILLDDFILLKTKEIKYEEITLNEGAYHIGKADVIRYVGLK